MIVFEGESRAVEQAIEDEKRKKRDRGTEGLRHSICG